MTEDAAAPANERMIERMARIDERQVQLAQTVRDLRLQITEDSVQLKHAIDQLALTLDAKYVTKTEFTPVRLLVYGLAGTVLLTVITAMLALVVRIAGVPNVTVP